MTSRNDMYSIVWLVLHGCNKNPTRINTPKQSSPISIFQTSCSDGISMLQPFFWEAVRQLKHTAFCSQQILNSKLQGLLGFTSRRLENDERKKRPYILSWNQQNTKKTTKGCYSLRSSEDQRHWHWSKPKRGCCDHLTGKFGWSVPSRAAKVDRRLQRCDQMDFEDLLRWHMHCVLTYFLTIASSNIQLMSHAASNRARVSANLLQHTLFGLEKIKKSPEVYGLRLWRSIVRSMVLSWKPNELWMPSRLRWKALQEHWNASDVIHHHYHWQLSSSSPVSKARDLNFDRA